MNKMKKIKGINPGEIRINVKPVMVSLIHTGVWEGPCRPESLEPSQEEKNAKEQFGPWVEEIKSHINEENAKILEPVHITHTDNFVLRQEEIDKLRPGNEDTDVYLFSHCTSIILTEIGKRFNKPVISVAKGCYNVDFAAHLRSRGYEGYGPIDYDELNKLISALRARKVFNTTSILFPTDYGLPPVWGQSGITDLLGLKRRFGIDVEIISYERLAKEMNKAMENKADRQKAEQLTDELIHNAQNSYIDRDYIIKDLEFYQTVKHLMDQYECNAFTIECFEFCKSRLSEKWKVVPCLTHTLMKDQGYASACEGDLNALLAMRLLMSVSRKSSFMGNPFMVDEDMLRIYHAVPGRKMNGYNQPDLPYELQHFVSGGWGTKLTVDLAENEEKNVTLGRFNTLGTKMLLAKGKVVEPPSAFKEGSSDYQDYVGHSEDVKGTGFNEGRNKLGCSVQVFIKTSSAREIIKKQIDYGQHLVMIYGDFTEEIQMLGEMLNLEIEYVSS